MKTLERIFRKVEYRVPPIEHYVIDMFTAICVLRGWILERIRDIDIFAAYPAPRLDPKGPRFFLRMNDRLCEIVDGLLGEAFTPGKSRDTIYELDSPLYGMLDAGDHFDIFYAKIIEAYTYVGKKNGTLLTYVMVLAHEEVTKHIFVLVPRELSLIHI